MAQAGEPDPLVAASSRPKIEEFVPQSVGNEKPSAVYGQRPDPAPEPGRKVDRSEELSGAPEENYGMRPEPDRLEAPVPPREAKDFTVPIDERETGSLLSARWGNSLSITPYLGLLGALLFLFSLLTLHHKAQPAPLETFIKAIPWIGSLAFKNNYLQQGIFLTSLRSGFQRIVGNREVFVITGEAVNRNSVSVREIRVEGLVFSEEGKELGRQAISLGNAISPKIIHDLTAREISILQDLSPHTRFEIPPEKSVSFTIVFLKPTTAIKAFGCQVLTAEEAV